MTLNEQVTLPDDVKQRFPSLRYWDARLRSTLTDLGATELSGLQSQIDALQTLIATANTQLALLQTQLNALVIPADLEQAQLWITTAFTGLPNAEDMSALSDGYVKIASGVPSSVADVPDEDIEYEQINVAALDVDWSLGRVFYKLLAGATALEFSNEVTGKQILVVVKQDAATAYACTWPAAVVWSGGTEPNLTSVSLGSTNVFSFVQYNDGASTVIVGTALTDAT